MGVLSFLARGIAEDPEFAVEPETGSAVLLFPLAVVLHERLLGAAALALSRAVAIAFHALELGRNVFARW